MTNRNWIEGTLRKMRRPITLKSLSLSLRLCVDPAWVHRKHVRLFLEIPALAGKSAEAIVLLGGRAEHKEKIRR
jgi:hypothetical protein